MVIIRESWFVMVVGSIELVVLNDKRINLNLLVCVRLIVNSIWLEFEMLNNCFSVNKMMVFRVSSLKDKLSISLRFFWSSVKLIFVFMVMKKSLSSSFWKGLMLDLSLWWNLLFVNMMFVIKVFRVGDKLISDIRSVIFMIIINVVVVKSLCNCVFVMNWRIGLVSMFLMMKIVVIVFNVIVVVWLVLRLLMRLICVVWLFFVLCVLWVLVVMMFEVVNIFGMVRSGMNVSMGMMVIFWKRRIEKFVWFFLFFINFFLLSVWRMIVVDDRDSIRLMVMVMFVGCLKMMVILVIVVVVFMIWRFFRLISWLCIC